VFELGKPRVINISKQNPFQWQDTILIQYPVSLLKNLVILPIQPRAMQPGFQRAWPFEKVL
jgi:hypothetical protein